MVPVHISRIIPETLMAQAVRETSHFIVKMKSYCGQAFPTGKKITATGLRTLALTSSVGSRQQSSMLTNVVNSF